MKIVIKIVIRPSTWRVSLRELVAGSGAKSSSSNSSNSIWHKYPFEFYICHLFRAASEVSKFIEYSLTMAKYKSFIFATALVFPINLIAISIQMENLEIVPGDSERFLR